MDELSRYDLHEVAARGGWSVVYRATDRETGEVVAVKAIAAELGEDEGFRARFRRECEIAAAVGHPNVIAVREVGERHAAMEWVEGSTLRDLLPLEPGRVTRIVAQVASALDAVHALRLVHRDVKPSNVLVGAEDHAYLTDFGLAKAISPDPGLTGAGRWLGTVDYAPPEQIRGLPVDERSDVYALGASLFHAVTGAVPYPRDDDAQRMTAHLHQPPQHDSPLDPVVRRAMAKDPAERFASAGELGAAALAAIASASG
jgi:serine/threonine protein kinase